MLNKPAGVLSATEDKNAKTAVDLLPANLQRRGVFVAGRLDKDTEGLLLLTDDGDFAHKVMSPKKGVFKKYFAKLNGSVTDELAQNFRNGITLADGTQLKPAFIEVLEDGTSAIVKICEGKFHQVKRMFETGGLKVIYLKRLSFGGLVLDDDLPLGKARLLSAEECEKIFVQSA
jgi:16S rRNA pseudouridine516 synthase